MKLNLFLLIVAFSWSAFAATAETQLQTDAQKVAALEALVTDYANEHRFSGSVLVAKNDHIIFQKAVGFANHSFKLPNKNDQAFLVGSLSKQFTAMAILQLVQDKKLKLSDTIGNWFPDFPSDKADKITIHHLLSHTSGLPHYRGLAEIGIDLENYDRVHRPLADYAKDIANMKLMWEPGTKFSYSSQGYILLGLIAEKVSGQSLNQLIQTRIVKPLGLKNTGFAYNETIVPNLALAYDYDIYANDDKSLYVGYRNSVYRDQTNTYSTGGIHSTTEDLFKWSQALLNYKLLEKPLQDKMMSIQADMYGYGFFIQSGNDWDLGKDVKIVTHGGATTGYRSQIAMLDNGAYTIIALGNSNISRIGALGGGMAQILYSQPTSPANILGTAIAWRLASEGKQSAMALFEKSKAKGFSDYHHSDYAYFAYAETFLKLERPQLARDITNIGLTAFPESAMLTMGNGDIYQALAKPKLAKAQYQKAKVLAEQAADQDPQLLRQINDKLAAIKI